MAHESESRSVSSSKLRVLELYSGIGGMHWALRESGIPYDVVMAIDINTTANQVYQHNFPEVNLQSMGIEKLSLKKLESLSCDTIMMSPPCQPFTRVGKKADCDDVRTKSFLHILQLIRKIDNKPRYILVENVKGFETSRTQQLLVETLHQCGYSYQEFLLNPLQFGIPNSRLRYYLTAKLTSRPPSFKSGGQILHVLPHDIIEAMHDNERDDKSEKNISHDTDFTALSRTSETVNSPENIKHHFSNIQSCIDEKRNIDNVSHDFSCKKVKVSDSENELSGDMLLRNTMTCNSCLCNSDSTGETVKSSLGCTKFSSQDNRHSSKFNHKSGDDDGMYVCDSDSCKSVLKNPITVEKDEELMKLHQAGRIMRFCEEDDELVKSDCRRLSAYMETCDEKDLQSYLLQDKDLRLFVIMDVVLPSLKKSTCFTKRYGHYIEGAGSVVQMSSSVEATQAASVLKSKTVELKNKHEWREEEISTVRKLKLRYFTPREVANLLCFPSAFSFPDEISNIQKYRVLGNSLNVHVVSQLVKFMVSSNSLIKCTDVL